MLFPFVQYLCYFYSFITSMSNFTAQTVLRLRMSISETSQLFSQTLVGFKAQMALRKRSQVWMVLLLKPRTLSLGCVVDWSPTPMAYTGLDKQRYWNMGILEVLEKYCHTDEGECVEKYKYSTCFWSSILLHMRTQIYLVMHLAHTDFQRDLQGQ